MRSEDWEGMRQVASGPDAGLVPRLVSAPTLILGTATAPGVCRSRCIPYRISERHRTAHLYPNLVIERNSAYGCLALAGTASVPTRTGCGSGEAGGGW